MKPLIIIAIALWLGSCVNVRSEARNAFTQRRNMAEIVECSLDNFVWENTGQYAAQTTLGFGRLYWHKAQCLGRDPEPLECYNGVIRSFNSIRTAICKTEDGGTEDYRTLTGLIESEN